MLALVLVCLRPVLLRLRTFGISSLFHHTHAQFHSFPLVLARNLHETIFYPLLGLLMPCRNFFTDSGDGADLGGRARGR